MKFLTASLRSLLVLGGLLGSLSTYAQPAASESRGQLLYSTHCIACHTTQMHWRNERKAQDWDTLKLQVRRWQGNAGLEWGDADIAEVARHLNDSIYHFPQTDDRVSLGPLRLSRQNMSIRNPDRLFYTRIQATKEPE